MRRKKSIAPPKPKEAAVLIATVVAVIALMTYLSMRHATASIPGGPKLLDADGTRYFACGGALWIMNEGSDKDRGAATFHVVYKDAGGLTHTLNGIRTLTVTSIPSYAPECSTH